MAPQSDDVFWPRSDDTDAVFNVPVPDSPVEHAVVCGRRD